MSKFEVEKKYRISENHSALSKLKSLNFKKKAELQIDKVFLYMSDSFKNFKSGDPVMRIRKNGDDCVLTMKKQINEESNLEIETKVSNIESMSKILEEIGFQEAVNVIKHRSVYLFEDAEICLDNVEGLGYFIEIEILCSENEQTRAKKKITEIAKKLSLKENEVETNKYDYLLAQSRGSNR